jgi:hypothetical protein
MALEIFDLIATKKILSEHVESCTIATSPQSRRFSAEYVLHTIGYHTNHAAFISLAKRKRFHCAFNFFIYEQGYGCSMDMD